MDTTAAEIAAILIDAALCGDCIAHKLGIPRSTVNDTILRMGDTVTVVTETTRCDSCFKQTVVHRLG